MNPPARILSVICMIFSFYLSGCQSESTWERETRERNEKQSVLEKDPNYLKKKQIDELNSKAWDLKNNGDYDGAIAQFKQTLATHNSVDAAFRLGQIYFEKKDYEQSYAYYKTALEYTNKPWSMLYSGLTAAALRTGRYYDAYIACRDQIRLKPTDFEIRYGSAADRQALKKDLEKLLDIIAGNLDFDPEEYEKTERDITSGRLSYYDIMKLALNSESRQKSILLLDHAIKIDPKNPMAYEWRMIYRGESSNIRDLASAFKDSEMLLQLARENPMSPDLKYFLYNVRARGYAGVYDYQNAIKSAELALDNAPDDREKSMMAEYIKFIEFLSTKGIKDKDDVSVAEVEYCSQKIAQNKNDSTAYIQRALSKAKLGDIDGAISDARLSGEYGNANAYRFIGALEKSKEAKRKRSNEIKVEVTNQSQPDRSRDPMLEWQLQDISRGLDNINSTLKTNSLLNSPNRL